MQLKTISAAVTKLAKCCLEIMSTMEMLILIAVVALIQAKQPSCFTVTLPAQDVFICTVVITFSAKNCYTLLISIVTTCITV